MLFSLLIYFLCLNFITFLLCAELGETVPGLGVPQPAVISHFYPQIIFFASDYPVLEEHLCLFSLDNLQTCKLLWKRKSSCSGVKQEPPFFFLWSRTLSYSLSSGKSEAVSLFLGSDDVCQEGVGNSWTLTFWQQPHTASCALDTSIFGMSSGLFLFDKHFLFFLF